MDSLSVIPKVINHALEASPSNSIGYGLAVALPILATIALARVCIRLYNQLAKERNETLADVKRLRNALEKERRERDRQDT